MRSLTSMSHLSRLWGHSTRVIDSPVDRARWRWCRSTAAEWRGGGGGGGGAGALGVLLLAFGGSLHRIVALSPLPVLEAHFPRRQRRVAPRCRVPYGALFFVRCSFQWQSLNKRNHRRECGITQDVQLHFFRDR